MAEGDIFIIEGLNGKKKLVGTIPVSGAKNAALKAIASSLLFRTPLSIENVPDIEDVKRMLDLVKHVGVSVREKRKGVIELDASLLSETILDEHIAKRLRASIVLTGPLLARSKRVSFPHPGGCVIGARPVDIFLDAYKKMGAQVKHNDRAYVISAPRGLRGADIFFRHASVTGTETIMMAAVLAKGTTTIRNAAMEPEIVSLGNFLVSSGAHISGLGTPTISIRGGTLLRAKKSFKTPPDRIEAGSFIILAALLGKRVKISKLDPSHLDALLEHLRLAGVAYKVGKDFVEIKENKKSKPYTSVDVKTREYPGFPTDLQAPMTVFLTQTKGESSVFETIFEGRLNYAESLGMMGASITPMDAHRVLVKGVSSLRGRSLESPDLRAGLAFVIAAAVAKGRSVIHNVYNIDRGYERVEERLKKIGLSIERAKA